MDRGELDLNSQDRVVKQHSDLLLEKESKLEELKMLHPSQLIIQGEKVEEEEEDFDCYRVIKSSVVYKTKKIKFKILT